jgi:hypothetical protein
MPVQIHPFPLQAGNLPGTAAGCQCKAHQRRQVVRTRLKQRIDLLAGQPPIPLDFAAQHTDFRKCIDPLPFVPSHTQQAPHGGEIAIHRCRFIALLQLPLDDRPDHVAVDLIQCKTAPGRGRAGDKSAEHPQCCEDSP